MSGGNERWTVDCQRRVSQTGRFFVDERVARILLMIGCKEGRVRGEVKTLSFAKT